ncbi:helix-turn-helix domain-containing protein [Hydrogenophaga sp. 5NK40-0174]|uniref:helix-turn-helix domain-containing protein n=1 Tax=Hydrogenophaga sp. 5NK40-0174 TaxID=3127649 RepID=UPI003102470A
MNTRRDRFNDVHLHATSVHGWGQTYSQISAGAVQCELSQWSTARMHAFREHINQRVVQHGEAPRDHICFAVPLSVPGEARVQGRSADDKCIFVLQGGDEFMFHMPMDMDMLSLTFEREAFEQVMSGAPWPTGIDSLLKQPVVQVPGHRLAQSRKRLLAMFDTVIASPMGVSTVEERGIEQAMLGELLRLISDPGCDRSQRHGSSSRSFIVEKCHRMTLSDAAHAPSVVDLCKRLRVSRRTVQNSFKSVTETNPVSYMRSVRLNGVRRELMATTPQQLSIGDAAAKWGFFHLSHFASEYHDLFAELPSQTQRAVRESSPQFTSA